MANEPHRRSLLLHPLTHAVYALEDDTIFHDYDHCIDMNLCDFEKLTQTGPCSAERLVEYAKRRNGGFHFSQLVFLKLRGNTKGYAWASRIRVHADWAVPEVDYHIFGQEFLWIWPTSAACNAFMSYQERNRLSMVHNAELEQYAPAVRHTASLPGAQIGPDDFDAVTHVPLTDLTPAQRFFISCIRPQRTQFQRRRLTDKWPAAMNEKEASMRQVDAAVATVTSEMRYVPSQKKLITLLDKHVEGIRSRKRCTTPSTVWTVDSLGHVPDQVNPVTYNFYFEKLPSEIVTRCVGTALAVAMTESVCKTSETICALRSTSKHMRTLTDGFVGITLAQLMQTVTGLVRTGSSKAATMLDVGEELRSLGVTPLLVLELRAMGLVMPRVEMREEYPLLRSYPTIPSWQRYLILRKRLDKSVAAEERLVKSNEFPSQVYKRFKQNGTWVRPEHDRAIANGSLSPSVYAMAMIEKAGV